MGIVAPNCVAASRYANADEKHRVPLEIIFRGKGLQVSEAELEHYKRLPNIRIRWQKKAWADEVVMLEYLKDLRADTADQAEILLGMDNHGSQRTFLCAALMEYLSIVPAYTPANCTDCTSPVDYNIGFTLKQKINEKYEAAYSLNRERWNKPAKSGGLSTREKRMLMATWASEAQHELATGHKRAITSAFVKTGFLLAKDGSENHLIDLGGKESKGKAKVPYDF